MSFSPSDENVIALAKQDPTYLEALDVVIGMAESEMRAHCFGEARDAAEESIAIVKARLEMDFPST